MSLTVKLEIYEGPLDLLLHLIKKNEVDIHDIPIAMITSQYLDYLDLMEQFNVEIAGEFLLMAATLTQIKSKMLLPAAPDDQEADVEDGADPREELVRALLDHMKMKDAAEVLERRTVLDRDVFTRPPADFGQEDPAPPGDDLVEASLFDLIDAFRRVVGRAPADSGLKINIETKTMGQRVAEIVAHLKRRRQAAFTLLCRDDRTRMDLVLSFLAVLELARVGRLKLYQHTATGELTLFYVERADPEEPEPDWERRFGDASG